MDNINDHFFDGYYKDIWKTIIPAELTVKEVDFMLPFFQLKPESKVLDLMCGYGRHALALAEKGIAVTAVDNLDEYVREVNKIAIEKSLPVKVIKADVATYVPEEIFELAICMGNSLNFFPANEMKTILKNTAAHLQPGGHLLINSWSIAEIAFTDLDLNGSSEINGIRSQWDISFFLQPTRFEIKNTMHAADGSIETKIAIDYIYSIAELEIYLHEAGMQIKEVYSIPGRKKFTLGEPRAYIVAEKIKT